MTSHDSRFRSSRGLNEGDDGEESLIPGREKGQGKEATGKLGKEEIRSSKVKSTGELGQVV
jgi:hypothetical protein